MRDYVTYKAFKAHLCEDGARRTVYVKGTVAPFVGWMATPDSYFSCDAYIRYRHGGRVSRVRGFVTPGEHEQEFRTFKPKD